MRRSASLESPRTSQVEEVSRTDMQPSEEPTAAEPSKHGVSFAAATDSPAAAAAASASATSSTGVVEAPAAGAYEKLRVLGRGAVAKVYLVRNRKTGELHAMKVMSKKEMLRRKRIHRVLNEKETLATLSHPFVINFYASFQTAAKIYFVMEHCKGGDFLSLLEDQPMERLDEVQTRFYAAEVLSGLEYIHSMGYIHRDLKPENILVTGDGHLRITDFDVSTRLDTSSKALLHPSHLRLTSNASDKRRKGREERELKYSLVGTPQYIAPEVINGEGHGRDVDWWSLGILIFEMLYGFTPFQAKGMMKTFMQIQAGKFEFPAEPAVSNECKDVIRRLLVVDPAQRLGHVGGAEEIKSHAFFAGVHFDKLANTQAPCKPFVPEDPKQGADSDDDTDDSFARDDDELAQDGKDDPFLFYNFNFSKLVQNVKEMLGADDDDQENATELKTIDRPAPNKNFRLVHKLDKMRDQLSEATVRQERLEKDKRVLAEELSALNRVVDNMKRCRTLDAVYSLHAVPSSANAAALPPGRRGPLTLDSSSAVQQRDEMSAVAVEAAPTRGSMGAPLARPGRKVSAASDGAVSRTSAAAIEVGRDNYRRIMEATVTQLLDSALASTTPGTPASTTAWVHDKAVDGLVIERRDDEDVPCMRAHVYVRAAPQRVFELVKRVTSAREALAGQAASVGIEKEIVEELDASACIVRLLYNSKSALVANRDFCVLHAAFAASASAAAADALGDESSDNTYLKMMCSVAHESLPDVQGCVRGFLFPSGFVIRSATDAERAVLRMDPAADQARMLQREEALLFDSPFPRENAARAPLLPTHAALAAPTPGDAAAAPHRAQRKLRDNDVQDMVYNGRASNVSDRTPLFSDTVDESRGTLDSAVGADTRLRSDSDVRASAESNAFEITFRTIGRGLRNLLGITEDDDDESENSAPVHDDYDGPITRVTFVLKCDLMGWIPAFFAKDTMEAQLSVLLGIRDIAEENEARARAFSSASAPVDFEVDPEKIGRDVPALRNGEAWE